MKNKKKRSPEELEASYKLYGRPITAKIDADLHCIIGDEAERRGISIAKHAGNLLTKAHQQKADENSQNELLLKERILLQKQVEELEKNLKKYSENDWKEFEKLKTNCELLRKLHSAGQSVTKVQLAALGFDFGLSLRCALNQEKQYYIILDMCYHIDGENIHIKPFQS